MEKDYFIREAIKSSTDTENKILNNRETLNIIENIIDAIEEALRKGKKILFCGNGGSAADAQHLAAELAGKFYLDREPISAEALHVNTSFLTAVANDISYNEVFARSIRGTAKKGDVLVAISTSGNSSNILKAIETANNMKMITVGLTGQEGGKMKNVCKYLVKVPSTDTPRIQESHVLVGHIICEIVEKRIFGA
ncbi:SIS domain-containing protein [Patescibacteria group bacterium]